MADILEVDGNGGTFAAAVRERVVQSLEAGGLIFLPRCPFEIKHGERKLLDPQVVKQPKKHTGRARIIFEPDAGKTRRANVGGTEARAMEAMVARYTRWAHDLVAEIVPDYRSALELGPTTFRPCPRAGPQGLHVDSFFFVPTQGRRVLRLFTNVNPSGEPRTWQVGRERFEPFARRLWPNVRRMFPGSGWALNRLGITKGRRTAYDHAMRQLRNLTKRDTDYQRNAPREVIEFPSSSTWLVFTDGLLHGALKGQFAFEQTFLSPVTTMREPVRSPLRVLEGLAGRVLAWGRLTKVRLINASCLSVYHQSCGYDRHGGTKTDPSQALGYGVRGVGALDSASQDASGRQTACANHPRLCRRAAGPRNRPASRRRRSRNGGGVSSAIVLREPAMRRARGVRAPSTTRRRPR